MRPTFLFAAVGVFLTVGLLAAGAPVVKEKVEPDKPETADMYAATTENLKKIALSFHEFHDTHGKLPANAIKGDVPLLSWRVRVLEFLDGGAHADLYKAFKLDEPWDSDHNKKLIDKMPRIYAPLRGKAKAGETFYQSFQGKDGMMQPGGVTLAGVTDGLSNSFMVAEADKPVIWTRPDDIEFDGKTAPALGGMFKDHFFVAFGDGSVRKMPKRMDRNTLVASITINGGEVFDLDAAVESAEKK
ncbi:MAG TPA: DUF1559 domain-containing protein [Gemmataceae bacterium]|nr:DUF1559 domain-containing protein [Gemmataceae bacterium]